MILETDYSQLWVRYESLHIRIIRILRFREYKVFVPRTMLV